MSQTIDVKRYEELARQKQGEHRKFLAQLKKKAPKNLDKKNLQFSMYDVLTADVPLKDVILKSELIQNLYIAPSTMELAGAEVEIINKENRETILLEQIKIKD